MMFEYEGTAKNVDGMTHLALSVMRTIYENGYGKDYPKEVMDIMQRILDLDRKVLKERRQND